MTNLFLVCVALLGYNSAPQSECNRNWGAKLEPIHSMDPNHTANKSLPHREIKLSDADIQRFWSKVSKNPTEKGCLLWQGGVFSSGYPLFSIKGEPFRANRVAYTIYHGQIPDGLIVLHGCDNPICVSKTCLHLGTNQDNSNEMVARGRQQKGSNHIFKREPWRIARGDRHMSVTRPESVVRGDEHWTRKNPDKLLRGENHPRFGKPVGNAIGTSHHLAKMDEAKVRELRRKYSNKEATQTQLAEEFGIRQTVVSDIVNFKTWKQVI